MPTGVPNLGCGNRRNFIQVNSFQTEEMQSPVETYSALPWDKGKATYVEKVLPAATIGLFFCKWGIQTSTVWLVQIVLSRLGGIVCSDCLLWSHTDWLVKCKWGHIDNLVGHGKSQPIGQNTVSGTPSEGWAQAVGMQCRRLIAQSVASSWYTECVIMNLCLVNHRESLFAADIFLLAVHSLRISHDINLCLYCSGFVIPRHSSTCWFLLVSIHLLLFYFYGVLPLVCNINLVCHIVMSRRAFLLW